MTDRPRRLDRRRIALILILIVDVSYIAWGGMAAVSPDHLLKGPGGKPILPAAYEGYSGGSWAELSGASPAAAGYMLVLYRMYGIYCALFGLMATAIAVTAFRRGEVWAWWTLFGTNVIALVAAMRMDWIVKAIGPFELTEYLGLALVLGAFAVTAPFLPAERRARVTFDEERRPRRAPSTVRPGTARGT
jgi:hypothetical protein